MTNETYIETVSYEMEIKGNKAIFRNITTEITEIDDDEYRAWMRAMPKKVVSVNGKPVKDESEADNG